MVLLLDLADRMPARCIVAERSWLFSSGLARRSVPPFLLFVRLNMSGAVVRPNSSAALLRLSMERRGVGLLLEPSGDNLELSNKYCI